MIEKRIGLFGGSFDPPHLGHVALVQAGLDMGLDEVWVIPALPVHRELSGNADGETRKSWLNKVFAGRADVKVLDWEVSRDQPTPAVDTLRRFCSEFPGVTPWLMLGADAWSGLESWLQYPAHQSLCNVAVFARKGMPPVTALAGWQEVKLGDWSACSTAGHWCSVGGALPDVSATDVRNRAGLGLSLAGLVPAELCRDIEKNYGSSGVDVTQTVEKNEQFEAMTDAIIEALEDKKAQDVLIIDVRGRCDFTDRFVIATGRSDRQLKALANSVSEVAHRYDMPAKIEGLEAMEWLIVDLGNVVVHLFVPEARESFQLERLWSSSKVATGES